MTAVARAPWRLLVPSSSPAVDRLLLLPLAGAALLPLLLAAALDDAAGATGVLRLTALLVAVAAAGAVDEPRDLLAGSPTTAARRLGARLLVVGSFAVPLWALVVVLVVVRGGGSAAPGVSLELAGLVAVGVAVGAVLRCRRDVAQPALLVGPVLVGLLLAAGRLPARWELLAPAPNLPGWGPAHARWAVVLVAALAITAQAYHRR